MNFTKPDKKTIITTIAAFIAAIYFGTANPENSNWLVGNLTFATDSFFHEFGHTISGWLFGYPSAPAFIVTWHFARSWVIQIIVFIILFFWCFVLWRRGSDFFHSAVAATSIVIIIALSGYHDISNLYMGHGGAVLIGSFFLYKAWATKNFKLPHHQFVFAFAGFLLIIHNMYFCYMLITNEAARSAYNNKHPFGMDNDFIRIAEQIHFLTVEKIAIFTICLGFAALVTPFLLAYCPKKDKTSY